MPKMAKVEIKEGQKKCDERCSIPHLRRENHALKIISDLSCLLDYFWSGRRVKNRDCSRGGSRVFDCIWV